MNWLLRSRPCDALKLFHHKSPPCFIDSSSAESSKGAVYLHQSYVVPFITQYLKSLLDKRSCGAR